VGEDNQLGMAKNFVQEGLAYRFTPFELSSRNNIFVDTEKSYDNLMHKFKFGGVEKPGIYLDENVMRMCYTHRRIYVQLAEQLMREGKRDKAKEVLDYVEKMIPAYNVPYDWDNYSMQMAELYYRLGEREKADSIMKALADKAVEYIVWYLSLDEQHFYISQYDLIEYHLPLLNTEIKTMKKYQSDLTEAYETKLDELYDLCVARIEG
jgi:tetratricopeptide (TPR) repeat protein